MTGREWMARGEDLGHAEQWIGDLEQRLMTAQKTSQSALFARVSDLMGWLREDLGCAEQRIGDLEQRSAPEPGDGLR